MIVTTARVTITDYGILLVKWGFLTQIDLGLWFCDFKIQEFLKYHTFFTIFETFQMLAGRPDICLFFGCFFKKVLKLFFRFTKGICLKITQNACCFLKNISIPKAHTKN